MNRRTVSEKSKKRPGRTKRKGVTKMIINNTLILRGGVSSVANAAEFISAAHLTVVKTVVNLC